MHRIPDELVPDEEAKKYCHILSQSPAFDIALLGVGPDGHMASLLLENNNPTIPVCNAPKLPPERVSISIDRLKGMLQRIVIITGKEKA